MSSDEAGPSSQVPPLFLPPEGPPLPRQHLASNQDLLARFNLLPAYNKHVLPYATQYSNDGQVIRTSPADKGKGREQDLVTPLLQSPGATGDGPEQEDDEGATVTKGEKKKKNNYKALIKGIPGKHSMKKDDYLIQTISVPPKERMRIRPFDERTQRDAFVVSLEGLKSWNVTTLIVESAQAREDRKRRKELKRLARAQQAQAAAAMQAVAGSSSPTVAHLQPLSATSSHRLSTSASPTPKSTGTPRPPQSRVPRPSSNVQRPGFAIVKPGAVAPRPSNLDMAAVKHEPLPPTIPGASSASLRGKKRERDDVVLPVNRISPTSDAPMDVVNGVPKIMAKAGIAAVRPRPVKKQRIDMQGQGKDVSAPVQQPTPQGV